MDDGDWTLFTIDKSRIEFSPKGLPEGRHRLEIAVKAIDGNGDRWLPPLRSAIVFSGFEPDANAKIEPRSPAGQKPFIEFLGDSITQGEGILHTSGGAVINSDALAAYAWLTGEALGTTHVQIAFGGSGVIRSGSGNVPPAPSSFAWRFSGSPADFSVVPDFILINLGTNDQYPSDEFVPAYAKLLREIRRHYARTVIFAIRPFMATVTMATMSPTLSRRCRTQGLSISTQPVGWMKATSQMVPIPMYPALAKPRHIWKKL